MTRKLLSRRSAAQGLAALAAWPLVKSAALAQVAEDRGIGGTGMVSAEGDGDRGIGGTGVVGTIRRFGSIWVNDLRITYDRSTVLTIDGRRERLSALRLGQVVHVLAGERDGRLFTRHIAVASEVVGRISAVDQGVMTVLGQPVAYDASAGGSPWRVGQRVAVSGLRRPDGLILASLIVPARGRDSLVAGPVTRDEGGDLSVGALALDPSTVGDGAPYRRMVLIGRERAGRFAVSSAEDEAALLARLAPGRLSLETLLSKQDGLVRFDPVLAHAAAQVDPAALPEDGLYRAVVSAARDPNGDLIVTSVHVTNRADGGSHAHGMTGESQPGMRGDGRRPGAPVGPSETHGPGDHGSNGPGNGGPGARGPGSGGGSYGAGPGGGGGPGRR